MGLTIETVRDHLKHCMRDAAWLPSQGRLSFPRILLNIELLNKSGPPPVLQRKEGANLIIDGHHRFVAGHLMGKAPSNFVPVPSHAAHALRWEDVEVSEEDW